MKKQNSKSEFRPGNHTNSYTHGFKVVPNPYENKWDHIPVKVISMKFPNRNIAD
jgi:hypothetical protein